MLTATTRRPTPAERLHVAVQASYERSIKKQPAALLNAPVAGEVARQLMAAKLDLSAHTSEGPTRSWLQSQEKSLLRELDNLTKGLTAVRQQLAALPKTT